MCATFGPAGMGEAFAAAGGKSSLQFPAFLKEYGLDCFEYQCGRGVNISLEKAALLGAEAKAHGIAVSLHAPYYISLSSLEPEKRDNSIGYILQSARAVNTMGGTRVVLHSGSCGKLPRDEALTLAKQTLSRAIAALDSEGLTHIRLCPEVMGKLGQLGTLAEVLALCALDERLLPCVDFGHLNARTHGGLKTFADFAAVFAQIENKLGVSRLREFHAHFSKIEYTAGGEKQHLTFADTVFGPDFDPVAEITAQKGLCPVIICESRGTQEQDALTMKKMYWQHAQL